jgi:hypothetical protein
MLSISGLHVAIIAGAMLLLLRLARLPPSLAALVALVVIAIYVAVIGAPPACGALRGNAWNGRCSAAWQRPTSPGRHGRSARWFRSCNREPFSISAIS